MHSRWLWILLSGVLMCLLAACGSGGTIPHNNFDRMTAQLVGGDGQPLAGVSVRVEGQDTGVVTDANGEFSLPGDAFPNGPDDENELSFGRNGVIYGSETVVPSQSEDATFDLGPTDPASGTASLNGVVYDENTSTPLAGVEVSVFSPNGGVYMDETGADGAYGFENLAAGAWQLAAYKDGYYPEMANVQLADGQATTQDLALTQRGVILPGEGLKVKGTLLDAQTNAPIGGALISMYVDTGYLGICDDGLYNDIMPIAEGTGSGAPGDARGGSMAMPFYYDPQYAETTTNADGTFEFPDEVIGYSLWVSMSADGYLGGSYYQSIDGLTGEVDMDLTLEPIIPTDIHGRVVDENGDPVEGAYVEFIYGMSDPVLGLDVPAGIDVATMAEQGQETRNDSNGTPPPPMMGGQDDASTGGMGWGDYEDVAAPGAPPSDTGSGADNMLMQQYRFEHRNSHGASAIGDPFTGYLSATTDANGEYSFEGVPAGDYYVFASAYRHLAFDASFTAQEDAAQNELNIVLANVPVGAVEGVVVDENGDPVPDALVNCTQPNVDPFTYTDTNGHYLIENVPTGDWIISAYKPGYLTINVNTPVLEDQTLQVNLTLNLYDAPDQETVLMAGRLADGMNNAGLADADLVFTPVDNTLGGEYYRHVTSAADGTFSVDLIANGEYNLLIQKDGYQDLYIRIWVDPNYPQLEFSLWEIGTTGGGWGGVVPGRPPVDGNGGSTDPGLPPEPPADGGGDDGTVIPL